VKQVVANLLTNAIKYNHTGGSVTISCESPNTYTLRINVEDTGLGISENDFDTLFEPFNRLGRESLNIEGTGVGLTITKALVEYMGGSIGIESKEGKGSKFFVTFNKAKAPVSEVTETKELPDEKHLEPMRERKTLLYVEDDNANLTLVKNILRRRPNIKLLTALDAESGIELVLEQHPDLILMDINLPQMDGYEALKKLKSNDATKRIPAIAISADAMSHSIKKGKTAGFLEYITKPLNVNNFLDVIDNIFKEERK
jgi:CheY-like chemotaxis protein/anti-sigma regulatory factor (Ser/Thr protein kinase)